jgi:trimeric autotransporter adhesin
MSTKTTFKRVALVAVAALGLGVMTSVSPASARDTVTVTLGTPTANVAVVGQVSTITAPVTITAMDTTETFAVAAVLSAKPVGSARTVNSKTEVVATGSAVDNIGGGTGDIGKTDSPGSDDNVTIYTASGAVSTAGTANTFFAFTPDVAGTYTFAVFLDGAEGITQTGAIKAADTVRYISVTALSAPATQVAITQPLAGTVATDATGRVNGAVLQVCARDAANASSRIDGSQQVLINLPSGVSVSKLNGSASTATTQYGIVAASFNSAGCAWVNVNSATAGTYAITAGLAGSTTLSTVSVTFVTPTGFSAAGSGATQLDGVTTTNAGAIRAGVSSSIYTSTSAATIARTQTSTTITAFAQATAVKVMLTVTDTNNRIFGNTGGTALAQDLVATAATDAALSTVTSGAASKWPATFTITHAALALSAADNNVATGYTVSPQDTSVTTAPSALNMAITGVNGAAASAYWDTVLPASTYLVVNGGTITVKAGLYSQYAVARPGAAVTARVTAGRNLQATATALITDAAGEVSFTVTDAAPTSATTFDTITFTDSASTGVVGTVTINYVAALTATTMTTSPSATTTTALSPADLGAINTATATASTGRDSVTATLLDAAGVAIVGMPVTLTVPAGVEFHSTTPAVAYTSATGVATWSVYTTKAGTYKFTATGGGLTKDFFGKWSGSNGRVVSVTAGTPAAGSTPVTIKVADAYGNGVGSVAVTVSATGGYFLGLPLSSSVNTNADGEIKVAFVGSGTVTATGAETQMFHGAALIGTTAAAGWPAGVSTASATVDSGASDAQVAADAAAEATDAANAATDAANAAAEAADAATAAAQDAADAVAALSTQVSEMVDALKKQITALTNLVIKIQKKVKA